MTKEEVEKIIKRTRTVDYSVREIRGRRPKNDLRILLLLMYYCHLKMVDALKITSNSITEWSVRYYSEKNKCEMEFSINSVEVRMDIAKYIYKNNNGNRSLILAKKRALQTAFQQIVAEVGVDKCRLTDIYFAGLRDNPNIEKPHKVKEC